MLTLRHRKLKIAVRDFAQASTTFATLREQSGEGGSTFPDGKIYEGSKLVARISYNGRVWPPEPWKPGDAPIYDCIGAP